MSLVYVFAASTMEAEPVRKIAAASKTGLPARCGANDVAFFVADMGPQNARKEAEGVVAMTSASAAKPDAIIIIGLCGGLTESLPEGRIVAYTACRSTETLKPAIPCWGDSINSAFLSSAGIRCDGAIGVTSSRFATTRDERLSLAAESGATVVDMETYPILEVAAAADIPAAVLRVVSDSIDRPLPNFNRALNDSGGLDGRKAFRVALGSPWRTAKLLAANKRAMQELSKALEIILKVDCFR